MAEQLDLLLTVMPRMVHDGDPSPGVASVSAAAKRAGFKSRCVDFNHIFYRKLGQAETRAQFWELDLWMTKESAGGKPVDFRAELSALGQVALDELFREYLVLVDHHSPRFLGLGLFSRNSRRMAYEFIKFLRLHRPNIQIILGGAGTTPLNTRLRGVVDYYVEGEGELAITEILSGRGTTAPGVNGHPPSQFEDLNSLPWPDYSDFALEEYASGGKTLRITGSRGCTRRCNFCNVAKIWPSYRFRSGISLAAEMLHQHQSLRTRPQHFIFTDSLINGKPEVLRDLCRALLQAREEEHIHLSFEGQFIAVSEKVLHAEDYSLLKQAGGERVYVGIESGSERLRFLMNKKFKDSDLDFTIAQLSRNNIHMTWFLMVGFGDEREEDFQQTLQLLRRYSHHNRSNYRIEIVLHEFTPFEGVEWELAHRPDLSLDPQGQWLYAGNAFLTHHERRHRLMRVEEELRRLRYESRQPSLAQHPDRNFQHPVT